MEDNSFGGRGDKKEAFVGRSRKDRFVRPAVGWGITGGLHPHPTGERAAGGGPSTVNKRKSLTAVQGWVLCLHEPASRVGEVFGVVLQRFGVLPLFIGQNAVEFFFGLEGGLFSQVTV